MPLTERSLGIRPRLDVHLECQALLRRALAPGDRVLDVGCGDARLVRELRRDGIEATGLEIDRNLVARARLEGLDVREGRAEALPFADASFDAVVCSVVVPYTDQRLAVREWGRVVRPGGIINATYHGPGYGLHYLLVPPEGFRSRFYGARMLLNTACYIGTGRRLPGFVGDTLCQSEQEMRRSYRASGLVLDVDRVVDCALGVRRIVFHGLRKIG